MLHVEKRGLEIHETSFAIRSSRTFYVTHDDRELLRYAFQEIHFDGVVTEEDLANLEPVVRSNIRLEWCDRVGLGFSGSEQEFVNTCVFAGFLSDRVLGHPCYRTVSTCVIANVLRLFVTLFTSELRRNCFRDTIP